MAAGEVWEGEGVMESFIASAAAAPIIPATVVGVAPPPMLCTALVGDALGVFAPPPTPKPRPDLSDFTAIPGVS